MNILLQGVSLAKQDQTKMLNSYQIILMMKKK